MAEIEFLIKLSDNSKIPQLFAVSTGTTANDGYWAAGKELYTYVGTSSSTTKGFANLAGMSPDSFTSSRFVYKVSNTEKYAGYARCVYDAWYWTDQTDAAYTTPGIDLGYKTTR